MLTTIHHLTNSPRAVHVLCADTVEILGPCRPAKHTLWVIVAVLDSPTITKDSVPQTLRYAHARPLFSARALP